MALVFSVVSFDLRGTWQNTTAPQGRSVNLIHKANRIVFRRVLGHQAKGMGRNHSIC